MRRYIVNLRKGISKLIDGHINIGNLTIYGDNAMHWGCVYSTKKYGYLCFRLPLPQGIADKIRWGFKNNKLIWHPLYFYISRNATPWASVFFIGKKHDIDDWSKARMRKRAFGWNYDGSDEHYKRLRKINEL